MKLNFFLSSLITNLIHNQAKGLCFRDKKKDLSLKNKNNCAIVCFLIAIL